MEGEKGIEGVMYGIWVGCQGEFGGGGGGDGSGWGIRGCARAKEDLKAKPS